MNMQTTFPPGTAPADARQHLALTLDLFERDDVEAAVDMLLELLDRADGDADREPNGDELDGNSSEDDFMFHGHDGPGCPVAECGTSNSCSAGDPSWTEWQTRGRRKVDAHGAEIVGRDRCANMLHEDAEDDDPREDDDADEEHDGREPDHEDGGAAVYAEAPRYGVDQSLGPVNALDAARNHDRAVYARNAALDRDWRAALAAARRVNA